LSLQIPEDCSDCAGIQLSAGICGFSYNAPSNPLFAPIGNGSGVLQFTYPTDSDRVMRYEILIGDSIYGQYKVIASSFYNRVMLRELPIDQFFMSVAAVYNDGVRSNPVQVKLGKISSVDNCDFYISSIAGTTVPAETRLSFLDRKTGNIVRCKVKNEISL